MIFVSSLLQWGFRWIGYKFAIFLSQLVEKCQFTTDSNQYVFNAVKWSMGILPLMCVFKEKTLIFLNFSIFCWFLRIFESLDIAIFRSKWHPILSQKCNPLTTAEQRITTFYTKRTPADCTQNRNIFQPKITKNHGIYEILFFSWIFNYFT